LLGPTGCWREIFIVVEDTSAQNASRWYDLIVRRLFLAFALAPAIPGFIMILLSILTSGIWEGIWVFALMSAIAYAVATVAGIPAFLVLRKFKANGLLSYVVAGQLLSIIPAVYLVLSPSIHQYGKLKLFPSNYVQFALIALIGLVVTLSFWLIARPDRFGRLNS
jgi:hypothetical protein